MIFFLLIICCCLISPLTSLDVDAIQKNVQKNAMEIVKLSKHNVWNDNLPKYYQAFLSNTFVDYVGKDPVFIYELSFTQSWGQFGNRLGHYFEIVTLCKLAGIHFVGFMRTDAEQPAAMIAESGIPIVYTHPNPASSREEAIERLSKLTKESYNIEWPWIMPGAKSFQNIDEVSDWTNKIVSKMQSSFHPNIHEGLKNESFDLVLNNPTRSVLPYIPSAVILTRCSDLIRAGHFDEYGFLNFNVYTMSIPRFVTEIYVLAEPLSYGNKVGSSICERFINNLAYFLKEKFSSATIAIQRGHAHHGFVQLSRASYVVCSPSTFCLWPGIANRNHHVYYQPSKLVAQGREIFLHDHFHWISYPKMFTYMMSEYDTQHPIETADAMARLAMSMTPRCEKTANGKNSALDIDNWDCNS